MLRYILPAFLAFCLGTVSSQTYLWPTNSSGDLSSNFGEFRDDHFHMGIDIKTGGKTGFPVYAVADGHISRVVTNYRGYGKALYLTTDDGKTATYAHLEKFREDIYKVVRLQQTKQKKYTLDMTFKPSMFAVKQGDILGFTGNSGNSFGPHLHFEIRDGKQRPLNPLVNGIPFSDTRRPVIYEIAVIPLYPGSKVNGNPLPQTFPVYMERGGTYFFPDTLHLDGTVGIAVRSADKREGVDNHYQVHSITMKVDGEVHYQVRYDKISFDESSLMNSVHDNRLARLNLGSFQNLYRSGSLPHVSVMDSLRNGILNLLPGQHELEISVMDPAGNEALFNGTVIQYPTVEYAVESIEHYGPYTNINIQPLKSRAQIEKVTVYGFTTFGFPEKRIDPVSQNKDGPGLIVTIPTAAMKRLVLQLMCENSLGAFGLPVHASLVKPLDPLDSDIDLRFSTSEGGLYIQVDTRRYIKGNLSIHVVRKDAVVSVPLFQIQPTVYLSDLMNPAALNMADRIEIHIKSTSGADRVIRHRMKPVYVPDGTEKLVLSNDNSCSMKVFSTSLYKPSVIWIETVENAPVEPVGGKRISSIYQLQPFELPAKDTFQVAMRIPEEMTGLKNMDLYFYNQKEEAWSHLKTSRKRDNSVLIAAHNKFDAIAVVQDTVPPVVTWSYPANGSRYHYQDIKTLRIELDDELSGIDPSEESLQLLIDGNRLYPAYQPVDKELSYELEGALEQGKHTIEVHVRDKAGNLNRTNIDFSVN